jgi:hypothetical protein
MTRIETVKSSFRDPGTQVFTMDGAVYRHIRASAMPHYEALMKSGLYECLVQENLLVPHVDVTAQFAATLGAVEGEVVIQPTMIPFISYPFEWSFSALKQAALTTLKIQKLCLDHNMTLQDASAFNVQFLNGHWVFIDTGSFQIREERQPWGAYRQFCQHFLAPLLLMAYRDGRLVSLFAKYLDGIPLDLANALLPLRAKCRLSVFLHIVMHSKYAVRDFSKDAKASPQDVSAASAYGLLDQLQSVISSLQIDRRETVWTAYEETHTYNQDEFQDKEKFILKHSAVLKPRCVWDLGANAGHFSRLVAASTPAPIAVTALEYDFMTVEAGMRKTAAMMQNQPLHLWMDLLNPSAGAGWGGAEWSSLQGRGPADLVLALALIHHICLAGNIGFEQFFTYLADFAKNVIIEFVPKTDPQSQRLLRSKKDIYACYTQAHFEKALSAYFVIEDSVTVSNTGRTLYALHRKGA